MRRWAEATQRRNLASLAAGQGPGGAPLAANTLGTIRQKGHGRVGFRTGELAAGLVAAGGYDLRVGGQAAEATVYAGTGATDQKINAFVGGQRGARRWRSEQTPSGKRKAWQYEGRPVPPRDFLGVDGRDVEAAAEDATDTILKSWGFA